MVQSSWYQGHKFHIISILTFFFPPLYMSDSFYSIPQTRHTICSYKCIRWTLESIFHLNLNQNKYSSFTPKLPQDANYITVNRNAWEMIQKGLIQNKCNSWISFFRFPETLLPTSLCSHNITVSAQNVCILHVKYPGKLRANHAT